MKYTSEQIQRAKELRSRGETYDAICKDLGLDIPKTTLSYWFRNVELPDVYYHDRKAKNEYHLARIREKSLLIRRSLRKRYFEDLRQKYANPSLEIATDNCALIALSMLCLGEASKYKHSGNTTAFYFSNSNPAIIRLFMGLMKRCFDIDLGKFRCTVQMRADQDALQLEHFWQNVTAIPAAQFYKTTADARTVGKTTRKPGYMGVLRINYFDVKIQHELEALASLCCELYSK